MVYVVAGVVVGAVLIAALVLVRRRSAHRAHAPDPATSPSTAAGAGDAPMTGLESALAQVTDRDGRPIGERLNAETEVVDELRVPDDTGPLLRRALDRLEHDETADDDPEPHDASDAG